MEVTNNEGLIDSAFVLAEKYHESKIDLFKSCSVTLSIDGVKYKITIEEIEND